MKIKILIINFQNPKESKYVNNPEDVGIFLLGRKLSNYAVLFRSEHRHQLVTFGESSDVNAITEHLEHHLESFKESVKESAY